MVIIWCKLLNFFDYIHTLGDFPKSGKALSVLVSFATKIQRRLVIDANKKTASGRRTATIITRRAPLKILLKKNMARIVISNEIEKQAHK